MEKCPAALWPDVLQLDLEQKRAHAAHLRLFLDEDLKVLVDDGDGQQDTRAGADGAEEVRQHREGADAKPSERSGRGDVPVQFVDHGVVAMTTHHHLLFFQLFRYLRTKTLY